MKVFKIVPRGYCMGVVNAIKIAKACREQYPHETISILGMIVHNQYIVDALEKLNIKTIDKKGKTRLELLDEIDEGVVIITAHGAGQNVFDKAKEKGLIVVDATCKDVIKTHDLIRNALKNNQEVLYIGKKGHHESEGAIAIDPKHIHLIEKKADIDLYSSKDQSFIVTNQTTMSLWDVQDISTYTLEVLKDVEIMKETCHATTIRQQAMAKIPSDVDHIIVVGDPHSNNTTRLANIAKDHTEASVELIESIEQLNPDILKEKNHIAVTAGASTPTYLTNMIIQYIEQFDKTNPETWIRSNFKLKSSQNLGTFLLFRK